jgi:hypothetical protein
MEKSEGLAAVDAVIAEHPVGGTVLFAAGLLPGRGPFLTTETQRHREDRRERSYSGEGVLPFLLCVSVLLIL